MGAAVAFLGYYAPWVAAGLFAAASLAGVVLVAMAWGVRRLLHRRGRTPCATCGYSVLDIARICPTCKSPTPLALERAASGAEVSRVPSV
jgi:predicted amidophosphoribosyltransferase